MWFRQAISGIGLPHETTHNNRFISQLLDCCPGNTPKVSNWSRNCLLERVMANTFGVFISIIQSLTCESVCLVRLVWLVKLPVGHSSGGSLCKVTSWWTMALSSIVILPHQVQIIDRLIGARNPALNKPYTLNPAL